MTVTPLEPPVFNGCLWPIDTSCLSDEWEALDEDLKVRSLAMASSSLESLIGHRVTACPVTVRPCISPCGCQQAVCGSCSAPCELTLDYIGELVGVSVAGEEMPLGDFEVHDRKTVVYVGDEPCPFTQGQDLGTRLGEPGTWSVTYLPAEPVDSLGAQAVTLLAMEFAKACTGDRKCVLPKGVRTISRFGMTYEVEAGVFPDGYTNIRIVDRYIDQWNPSKRRQPLGIFSPDSPTMRFV